MATRTQPPQTTTTTAAGPAVASSPPSSLHGAIGALPNVTDAAFEAAADCAICDKKFHAFRRKHRCRSCGNAVCGSCARTHKIMPSTTLMRYNNEPVRVCDRCIRGQTQMLQERRRAEDIERARARQQAAIEAEARQRAAEQRRREEEEHRREEERIAQLAQEAARRRMQLRSLELQHFGPRPPQATLVRSRSLEDCHHSTATMSPSAVDMLGDVEKRALEILDMAGIKTAAPNVGDPALPTAMAASITAVQAATVAPEAEECAICLDSMDVGQAIYTTACGHSFHWRCLKEIQLSDAANCDKCPSCRSTMEEMQIKKKCDHPRVRLGHRFCRDCGSAVTERDARPRPDEGPAAHPSPGSGGPVGGAPYPGQPMSYRANSQGALVRCPQCQIQMRVLPHMYNMRVACPSGHMFLVQVAAPPGQQGGGLFGRGGFGARGRARPMTQSSRGYPGSSYSGL